MKRNFIKFIICLFILFVPSIYVKADESFDTDKCIQNYGSIEFKSVGDYHNPLGKVKFTNENNNKKWNVDPVTFEVEIKAKKNYKVKSIEYKIFSKDGYSCDGKITGTKIDGNTGNVKLKVKIDKGYVMKMAFWGSAVNMNDSNKNDQIPSDQINVKKVMTEDELEEIGYGKLETGESLTCKTLNNLFGKYWSWLMILAPVGTIILITVDFIKPITANDADALKNAGNKALKRTIALVVLLVLPLIIDLLFGLFGLDFCFLG